MWRLDKVTGKLKNYIWIFFRSQNKIISDVLLKQICSLFMKF